MRSVLSILDACCKWVVSGAVFLAAILTSDRHHVATPFYVVASLFAAVVAKGLKRVLQQPRPAGTKLKTSGMPSSHATCLWYLAVAATVGVYRRSAAECISFDGAISFATSKWPGWLLAAGATFFTSLRVVCAHHTAGQAAAGTVLGTAIGIGAAWLDLEKLGDINGALTAAQKDFLLCAAIALSCLFTAKYVSAWMKES